jgi:hypothetical protein
MNQQQSMAGTITQETHPITWRLLYESDSDAEEGDDARGHPGHGDAERQAEKGHSCDCNGAQRDLGQ